MKNLLLLSLSIFTMNINAQIVECNELFFSEYVEGYGQNKAIEIYNPTNSTIDLSDYQVERYSNGSVTSLLGGVTSLSGMLASGDVFVLTSGETDTSSQYGYIDSVLFNMRDFAEPVGSYPTPMHMNGNDAIVLSKGSALIDIIGKVGEDPGVCWTDNEASGCVSGASAPFNPGTWYTTGHTLIRKDTVKNGVSENPTMFNPSLEWDTLPIGTWNNLGSHSCDCITPTEINEKKEKSYLIYPNPVKIGDNVIVNSIQNIKEIKLIDLFGEKVRVSNQINTSELATGTYIIMIEFMDGEIAKNKLVIQ